MQTFVEYHDNRLFLEAARRSFARLLTKWGNDHANGNSNRPVAIVSAFRKPDLGNMNPEEQEAAKKKQARLNKQASEELKRDIVAAGLSYVPVIGAGQEPDSQGNMQVSSEESFMVQPRGKISEDKFISIIRELIFHSRNPQHRQWGAAIKLPSHPEAFLLHADNPSTPLDYNTKTPIGSVARPRSKNDMFYTQMKSGPRADATQMSSFENPSSTGRRFAIKSPF